MQRFRQGNPIGPRGRFYLFFKDAAPEYYGAVRSKVLREWEDCSKEMTFPKAIGTVRFCASGETSPRIYYDFGDL
jgi:hypothetical protein